jgi:hypothetical protein
MRGTQTDGCLAEQRLRERLRSFLFDPSGACAWLRRYLDFGARRRGLRSKGPASRRDRRPTWQKFVHRIHRRRRIVLSTRNVCEPDGYDLEPPENREQHHLTQHAATGSRSAAKSCCEALCTLRPSSSGNRALRARCRATTENPAVRGAKKIAAIIETDGQQSKFLIGARFKTTADAANVEKAFPN